MKLTGDRIDVDNTSEFICKEVHDNVCKCGSGTFMSLCPTREYLERPIKTAYKTGQTNVLYQVVQTLNSVAASYRSEGMDESAITVDFVKELLMGELEFTL